ncbi:hypothetical protein HUA74_23290 [Myxococcus sp. CA051A]|uniref:Uncharacterized protein n=1 Tax=Myxococcus llanfairpwllgwyngyllgogerychwyrndrobwllllantysiliogogogochensis TaxID=2590453 RepID=A0A540X9U7_9BACT|nr:MULTISPECIES: hypothetical protein [Myxococcus]NTX17070.1 hypothetical protein [Myxococcus sp. CA056]NTX35855.1 hypothetical protein [Myxococcus sp. CA033]NTX50042.1 hypothetical protein [Myxococcus sp. CA039A]NTX63584.1 hypothetical protein [Myxococcus sp. CA051A]TQF18020.1 hypothetical protein FJV41_00285 [Myxococcus llanfairpwllgwyngyllgogerychwyrndrobwllllantysiliogogogochensis]
MTEKREQPQRTETVHPPDCEAAVLFEVLWSALADLLGTPATATLIRRSLKHAARTVPELQGISVSRERFEYHLFLPPEWKAGTAGTLDGLREVARELQPLLRELTGPVVLRRLRGIPEIERCRLFPPEDES